MDQQKWQLIQEHFSSEKEYINDGYYRLRSIDDGYQMAYLVPGQCGETLIHPEITIHMIEGKAVPVRLYDLETTPTTRLDAAAGDQAAIEEAAEELMDKFLKAKQLD
ncbi:hypothetical protein NRIC_17790 [Enterococcus florum]|uniref:Uncharacterized protein n=1 Tax=Enterococcus florum TaxID=2480627 RepID=A0A4P5PD09_9ENTE|nr:hypothetical protein [Enterococcus florum]GCF93888.1 hypothetical protein NRIC_17790 [Enterococcus florum]